MFCLETLEGVVAGNGWEVGGGALDALVGWAEGEAAGRKEAEHREPGVRSCRCW